MRLTSVLLKNVVQKKPRSLLRKTVVYGTGLTSLASGIAIYKSVDSIEDVKELGFIRFGRASQAIASIIFDYKYSLMGLESTSKEFDDVIKQCHQRSATKLLELAKRNGGVFIKVGQHIAAMEYLVPPEYTKTLYVLMSQAPQASYDDVKKVIEEELKQPMDEIFSSFSKVPVGAASLAQVHPAILKETGEKVAVKVQHRRVLRNSKTDIQTMEFLVNVAYRLSPEFHLMWLVKEIKKNLPNELDFLHEARNADKVRKMFSHLPFLKIPRIIYPLSTPRLLMMEFCEGAQIDNLEYLKKNNIDPHDICKKMGKLIAEMIFQKGYLHADPHPGNVLVNKRPTGEVDLVLLDHGLYLNVEDKFRKQYSDLWLAILSTDQIKIKKAATAMGVGELYGLFACIVTRRSWKSVTSGIQKSNMDGAEKQELRMYAYSLVPQISELLGKMPREMLLVLKTNDLLRNLEHILGSKASDSLMEMSKCVVRSHHELALKASQSKFQSIRIELSFLWLIFKIRTYEMFLYFKDSLGLL